MNASAKSLDTSAAFWSPRRHKIVRLGKDPASATNSLDASAYNICRLGSLFGEICFQDVVYISLDSMPCGMT